MVDSRLLSAAVGLAGSLSVSVLLWLYFDTFLFFLFLPVVPFLFRGVNDEGSHEPTPCECPQCGFQTRNDGYDYCPRDGRRLRERSARERERDDGWS